MTSARSLSFIIFYSLSHSLYICSHVDSNSQEPIQFIDFSVFYDPFLGTGFFIAILEPLAILLHPVLLFDRLGISSRAAGLRL